MVKQLFLFIMKTERRERAKVTEKEASNNR